GLGPQGAKRPEAPKLVDYLLRLSARPATGASCRSTSVSIRFFLSEITTVAPRLYVSSQGTSSSAEKNAIVESHPSRSFSRVSPVWERSGPASPLRCLFPRPPFWGHTAVERSLSTVAATAHAGGDDTRDSGVTMTSFGRSSRPFVFSVTFGAP